MSQSNQGPGGVASVPPARFYIYTDGSVTERNPSHYGAAGAWVIVEEATGGVFTEGQHGFRPRDIGRQTCENNNAEMAAIAGGLKEYCGWVVSGKNGAQRSVRVVSDSKYAMNVFRGIDRDRAVPDVVRRWVREATDACAEAGIVVQWEHIPGTKVKRDIERGYQEKDGVRKRVSRHNHRAHVLANQKCAEYLPQPSPVEEKEQPT